MNMPDGTLYVIDREIVGLEEGIMISTEDAVILLKSERDSLLAQTDNFALSDRTLSDEMRTYRQALRDLPTHSNWPDISTTDWPSKPE